MWEVTAINFGRQWWPSAGVFHFGRSEQEWLNMVYYVWLLKGHGKAILVDTGIGSRHLPIFNPTITQRVGERAYVEVFQDLPEALAPHGVGVDDIDGVILTHFHPDHAYNVSLFEQARFYVSRRGWGNLMAPEHPKLVDPAWYPDEPLLYLVGPARQRLYLCDDVEEILPGLHVVYTGGHSPDHQMVNVRSARGTVAICGDVVTLYDHVERYIPVGSPYNLVQSWRALDLARAADIVVPSHDERVLDRHPGGKIA